MNTGEANEATLENSDNIFENSNCFSINKICIVGAGSIGCIVGARLSTTGANVTLIGRTSLLKAMEDTNGLLRTKLLDGCMTDHAVGTKELQVTSDMSVLKEATTIIVAVKSTDTVAVAKQIRQIIGDEKKPIISFQNGVRNPLLIKNELPSCNIVPALVEFNAVWLDDATFVQTTAGKILIGDDETAMEIVSLLVKVGFDAKVEPQIEAYQYGKLLINLNNAVNALSGVPLLSTLKEKNFRIVVAASMEEAISVFSKANIVVKSLKLSPSLIPRFMRLPDFIFSRLQPYVVKVDANAKLSMLQDLEKQRSTEINFLNGEIVKVAREHGLPLPPFNATIVKLVQEAELKKDGSPMMNSKDLLDRCNSFGK